MIDLKNYENREYLKRDKELVLIASENYPPQEILDACGSIFSLKYSEGFCSKSSEIYKKAEDRITGGARYYEGCEIVDEMEQDCINTCLKLFNAEEGYYANVQPNSGCSANIIVYNSILEPKDKVLAMDTKAGAHISHGIRGSFLSKYHDVSTYDVDENGCLDYDKIEWLAYESMPKLIICGASNYPREIDFKKFKDIADKVGAKLMADIAHISILCAHNLHQSPVGYADYITFTTHKCMAGPRGGVILYKKEYDKSIRFSTIPSLFGGALQQQIYGKLICFRNALTPKYREYSSQILKNAQVMARVFDENKIPIVTGKTENHLMTINLTNFKISGKEASSMLAKCGVISNCNTIPNDPRSFLETSGVRLGTPAITMRGLKENDVEKLTQAISKLLNCYQEGIEISDETIYYTKRFLLGTVKKLTQKYPLSNIYRIGYTFP